MTFRDRETGKTRKAAGWAIEFRDHQGIVRRLAAHASKAVAREIGRHVERLASFRAAGLPPDDDEAAWLESVPAGLRRRLVKIGLLDGRVDAASRPLAEHLKDFHAALVARGCAQRHADLVAGRARRVVEGCGFKGVLDVDAGAVMRHLAGLRADGVNAAGEAKRGISNQTHNFYVQAVQQFCRWLVDEGRAATSPVARLRTLNVQVDRRHDRRALTIDECRRLLAATAAEPERFGVEGVERALVYRVALTTGLRRGELASLARASFDLDGRPPTVTVAAAYSKRRRDDVLALRPDVAAELRVHLALKAPAAPAFAMPPRRETAPMFRADLAAAGIAYADDEGKFADFHALRHTFITHLARSGVHPKVAQVLARHSTITLTMDRYSHTILEDRTSALAGLPDLYAAPAVEAARATGTDGDASTSVPAARSALCSAFLGAGAVDNGGQPRTEPLISGAPVALGARRGAGAVERTGFENRRGLRATGGSNPSLSANFAGGKIGEISPFCFCKMADPPARCATQKWARSCHFRVPSRDRRRRR